MLFGIIYITFIGCKGTKKAEDTQYHNPIILIYQTLGMQLHHHRYCENGKIAVPLQPKIIIKYRRQRHERNNSNIQPGYSSFHTS